MPIEDLRNAKLFPVFNIKLSVKNLNESIDFYKRVFPALGFASSRLWENDPYEGADTWTTTNGRLYLELQGIDRQYANERFSEHRAGLYRIEFLAESRDEVDDFHRHLLEQGAEIVRGPESLYEGFADEGDFWYAVYFKDLDGIIFGLIHTTNDIE